MTLDPPLAVRVVYILPEDAQPWLEVPLRATQAVEVVQQYVRHEMKRHHYGERTFKIDRKADGLIHFSRHESKYTKAEFEQGSATALHLYIDEAGKPEQKYVELLIVEAYSVTDGVVSGDMAGNSKRRVCLSSLHFKAALLEWIDRDDEFFGRQFPWITSEPIKAWKHRKGKLGNVAGACFGVITHELLHSFGADDHVESLDTDTSSGEDIMGRTGRLHMRRYLQRKSTAGCVLNQRSAKKLLENLPD